jgi:hypothetical protein
VIHQNTDASFVWMKTVWLVEFCIPHATLDTLKEERIKRHAPDTREVGINPVERNAVIFTPIRWRPHAGQQQPRVVRLYFCD